MIKFPNLRRMMQDHEAMNRIRQMRGDVHFVAIAPANGKKRFSWGVRLNQNTDVPLLTGEDPADTLMMALWAERTRQDLRASKERKPLMRPMFVFILAALAGISLVTLSVITIYLLLVDIRIFWVLLVVAVVLWAIIYITYKLREHWS